MPMAMGPSIHLWASAEEIDVIDAQAGRRDALDGVQENRTPRCRRRRPMLDVDAITCKEAAGGECDRRVRSVRAASTSSG